MEPFLKVRVSKLLLMVLFARTAVSHEWGRLLCGKSFETLTDGTKEGVWVVDENHSREVL